MHFPLVCRYNASVNRAELLKPDELDAHVAMGTFRLAFVGMSNAGKSYRSKVLHNERDFLWYHVDEEIQKALGFADMSEISTWMGYPTSEGYTEREQRYLELENLYTAHAAMQTHGKNLVFDTTGSVIHLQPETLQILSDNCLVVNLEVPEDSLQALIEKFFEEPKPVAWCGRFNQLPGEDTNTALRRCYPALLHARLSAYRAVSHITIPAPFVRDTTADETLRIIQEALQ